MPGPERRDVGSRRPVRPGKVATTDASGSCNRVSFVALRFMPGIPAPRPNPWTAVFARGAEGRRGLRRSRAARRFCGGRLGTASQSLERWVGGRGKRRGRRLRPGCASPALSCPPAPSAAVRPTARRLAWVQGVGVRGSRPGAEARR